MIANGQDSMFSMSMILGQPLSFHFCANIHVTRLMFHHMFLLISWDAPAESAITVASVNPTQVVVALAGGHLVYLDVEDGAISEVRHNVY